MKRVLHFLFVVALMNIYLISSAWALNNERVFDEADILSIEDEKHLAALITQFQMECAMDFVLLTIDEEHAGISQQAIADTFYDQGGFGMGVHKSGILYMIDMYERIPYLCTSGDMIDYMTDKRIKNAHEICFSALVNGEYAEAIKNMLTVVKAYVYDGVPLGRVRYEKAE